MSHSPFPWSTHPQVTSAVFDADGKRIVDAWHPIDPDTAADNAALIAAIPAMVQALQVARDEFESIRLLLIHELNEPTRSAFWKSVNARDKIAAVLASIGKMP